MESDLASVDVAVSSGFTSMHGSRTLKKAGWLALRLIVSLWILITVCFFLMHVMPGNPFQDEQGIPEEVLASLRHTWGLDKPLFSQYISYIVQLLHGDLGHSLRYPSETVWGIIARGFPISFFLGIQAFFLAIPIGFLLGGLSAYYANRPVDIFASFAATLGISIPSFVFAAFLQLTLATLLPIFPVARSGTFFHTLLPSFALALGPACAIMRLMRASVLDTLSKEWVVTARMKGLSECRVLFRHVFPNAILPVVHYFGPTIANLLVGSFVVERVFGIPGLGQWFVNGVITRDYSIISGLTLFYSIVLYFVHTVISIITNILDSRTYQKPGRER